jgi:hypothetical protein
MAETIAAVITMNNDEGNLAHRSGKIVTATDAAALNVPLGFKPSKIVIENVTNVSRHTWQKGMAEPSCIQEIPAGDKTVETTGCISMYAGSSTVAPGFTIGTNAVLNTAGDTLYFIAYR